MSSNELKGTTSFVLSPNIIILFLLFVLVLSVTFDILVLSGSQISPNVKNLFIASIIVKGISSMLIVYLYSKMNEYFGGGNAVFIFICMLGLTVINGYIANHLTKSSGIPRTIAIINTIFLLTFSVFWGYIILKMWSTFKSIKEKITKEKTIEDFLKSEKQRQEDEAQARQNQANVRQRQERVKQGAREYTSKEIEEIIKIQEKNKNINPPGTLVDLDFNKKMPGFIRARSIGGLQDRQFRDANRQY